MSISIAISIAAVLLMRVVRHGGLARPIFLGTHHGVASVGIVHAPVHRHHWHHSHVHAHVGHVHAVHVGHSIHSIHSGHTVHAIGGTIVHTV